MIAKKTLLALLLVFFLQALLLANLVGQRPFLDEGRYTTAGWLISRGALPYVDMLSPKPPGIEFVLAAAFSLFGASMLTARMLMAAVACAQTFIVFLIARKMFGERAALFSALFYALWSVQFSAYIAVIEPFLALFASIAVLFLYSYLFEEGKERQLFAGCFFLGMMIIFKQTMLPFALGMLGFLFLFNYFKKKQAAFPRPAAIALSGFVAIPLLFLLYLLATNTLPDFIQLMLFPLGMLGSFFQIVLDTRVLVAVLAFSPIPMLLWMSHKGFLPLKQKPFEIILLLLWFLFAFSNTFPFRGCCMHLLPSLPAASVAAGAVIYTGLRKPAHKGLAIFSLFILVSSIASALFFQYAFLSQEYSFRGIEEVASYIKENSGENDSILVLPASPELYFLSQRKPATRRLAFFHEYSEIEQQQTIDELLKNNPRFIVYFVRDSGDAFSGLALVDQFIKDNYGLGETIEMTPPLYKFFHYALVFEPK